MSLDAEKQSVLLYESRDHIHQWQEETRTEREHLEQGVIASLCHACQDLLQCMIKHLDSRTDRKRDRRGVQRVLTSLILWSDGYGASTGALDVMLDRSKGLRLTTLTVLHAMCKALVQAIQRHVLPRCNDDGAVSLITRASKLDSQVRWLLTDDDDGDSADSDSDSDADSASDGDRGDGIGSAVQHLRTYVGCLVDLGTALDCPALEPAHEHLASTVTFEQRSATDYHTDLIKAKFPEADPSLLQTLGNISWDRYRRMQQERESNAKSRLALTSGDRSDFKDSGMGSSVPQTTSTYAETTISFMTNVSKGKRVNIPPLPVGAKGGLAFECVACGGSIQITTNREWRKHLYKDLQPYTCLIPNCSLSKCPFIDRQLWTDHLELDHRFGPAWKSIHCHLCQEPTGSGKSAILIHFARHMEEIALASLPRDVDSDSESASDTNSDIQEEALEPRGIPHSTHTVLSEQSGSVAHEAGEDEGSQEEAASAAAKNVVPLDQDVTDSEAPMTVAGGAKLDRAGGATDSSEVVQQNLDSPSAFVKTPQGAADLGHEQKSKVLFEDVADVSAQRHHDEPCESGNVKPESDLSHIVQSELSSLSALNVTRTKCHSTDNSGEQDTQHSRIDPTSTNESIHKPVVGSDIDSGQAFRPKADEDQDELRMPNDVLEREDLLLRMLTDHSQHAEWEAPAISNLDYETAVKMPLIADGSSERSGMDSVMAAHMSMEQALMDQGDDLQDSGPSRLSRSSSVSSITAPAVWPSEDTHYSAQQELTASGLYPSMQSPTAGTRHSFSELEEILRSSHVPPKDPNHVALSITGSYKCDQPGCTAYPFQTQDLLDSHMNVHLPSRPHSFPVKGAHVQSVARGSSARTR